MVTHARGHSFRLNAKSDAGRFTEKPKRSSNQLSVSQLRQGKGMTIKDTSAMIAGMTPKLGPDIWVYCSTQDQTTVAATAPNALAVIREVEGVTLILAKGVAKAHGFDTSLGLRQITLTVFSDLEGVGLTAAVAAALTNENIPCNVIAAFHHDHVLVPEATAHRAMEALIALQLSHKG